MGVGPLAYSPAEAAKLGGISVGKIYEEARANRLTIRKSGRRDTSKIMGQCLGRSWDSRHTRRCWRHSNHDALNSLNPPAGSRQFRTQSPSSLSGAGKRKAL